MRGTAAWNTHKLEQLEHLECGDHSSSIEFRQLPASPALTATRIRPDRPNAFCKMASPKYEGTKLCQVLPITLAEMRVFPKFWGNKNCGERNAFERKGPAGTKM